MPRASMIGWLRPPSRPAGIGNLHAELHRLAQEVDRIAADLEGGDGIRPALLDARQMVVKSGAFLRMEVGRHDRDAGLLGHRLEASAPPRPKSVSLADDRYPT